MDACVGNINIPVRLLLLLLVEGVGCRFRAFLRVPRFCLGLTVWCARVCLPSLHDRGREAEVRGCLEGYGHRCVWSCTGRTGSSLQPNGGKEGVAPPGRTSLTDRTQDC